MQHFQSAIYILIARLEFEAAVRKHQAERHARGFSSWTQMIAMLFCQLGHAQSLREITGGLAACEGKLRHLGVTDPPSRSTLSYANKHRPWQLFETVFYVLLSRCQAEAQTHKRKFQERWQIELFFKALKQSLKVKTFVGTSENAVQTQIWTALIAMLLIKRLQMKSSFGWSLSNLVALLRQQLFVYRDLFQWLNDPFQAPPALTGIHDDQLNLVFGG
jgi:hypothetical protein